MVDANPKQTFRKTDRVVRQPDFDRVHQSKRFAADRYLVVKAIPNRLDRTRLGLSVSRRVGNAVVRNRWKRTIREAFRLNRHRLPAGWDLVVRPRKGAVLDFRGISGSLVVLVKRIARNGRRRS